MSNTFPCRISVSLLAVLMSFPTAFAGLDLDFVKIDKLPNTPYSITVAPTRDLVDYRTHEILIRFDRHSFDGLYPSIVENSSDEEEVGSPDGLTISLKAEGLRGWAPLPYRSPEFDSTLAAIDGTQHYVIRLSTREQTDTYWLPLRSPLKPKNPSIIESDKDEEEVGDSEGVIYRLSGNNADTPFRPLRAPLKPRNPSIVESDKDEEEVGDSEGLVIHMAADLTMDLPVTPLRAPLKPEQPSIIESDRDEEEVGDSEGMVIHLIAEHAGIRTEIPTPYSPLQPKNPSIVESDKDEEEVGDSEGQIAMIHSSVASVVRTPLRAPLKPKFRSIIESDKDEEEVGDAEGKRSEGELIAQQLIEIEAADIEASLGDTLRPGENLALLLEREDSFGELRRYALLVERSQFSGMELTLVELTPTVTDNAR